MLFKPLLILIFTLTQGNTLHDFIECSLVKRQVFQDKGLRGKEGRKTPFRHPNGRSEAGILCPMGRNWQAWCEVLKREDTDSPPPGDKNLGDVGFIFRGRRTQSKQGTKTRPSPRSTWLG